VTAKQPPKPLAAKLAITDDSVFTVVHPPPGFDDVLGDVGRAIRQHHLLPPIDVVLAFFTSRSMLRSEFQRLAEPTLPAGALWIACPRVAAVGADLDERSVRAEVARHGWVDDMTCAVDAAWVAVRCRRRPSTTRRRGASN